MTNNNWIKCLINGDSKEIIKRIPDNSIDFILTDPPYNLSKHSTGNINLPGRSALNNDVAEWDAIEFNPEEWADEFIRILKPTGNLFIFTSYNHLGRWYNCLDHKFDTTNFMVWHKTNPAPKIFKAGFLNSCELIFTCWNKKHTWNFLSQAEMHNFIETPICMKPERLTDPKHPTQKPVAILKKMISIATNENDIVFDPFMGTASTGVAALELGRKFIGIEKDKSYFMASQKRINDLLTTESSNMIVEEPAVAYQNLPVLPIFDDINDFVLNIPAENSHTSSIKPSKLEPIIKWAGGKEKELKYILPDLPAFNRYFEPFVGGGAVFTAIDAKELLINDLSKELISLYKNISTCNSVFFNFLNQIILSWSRAKQFFNEHLVLLELYKNYRDGKLSQNELKYRIYAFCDETDLEFKKNVLGNTFASMPTIINEELKVNLFRKMSRMNILEKEKGLLPEKDLFDNIETAIKSALYMNYRMLYNSPDTQNNEQLYCAIFTFIRNYAYSGMFRYNDQGLFNVPYGGIAYNSKSLRSKYDYYNSPSLQSHLNKTKIFNLDFEDFLRQQNPLSDDFIFLDPPYDTDFSTYAKNEFNRNDQIRLANYLINDCKAKWMLVIKQTEFILDLYKDKPNIYIKSFDKKYQVSFMNRNNRKATHLMITNY